MIAHVQPRLDARGLSLIVERRITIVRRDVPLCDALPNRG